MFHRFNFIFENFKGTRRRIYKGIIALSYNWQLYIQMCFHSFRCQIVSSLAMMNFNIFVLQQSILTVETVEHTFPEDPSPYLFYLVGLFCLLIIITNGYLLFFVFKQSSRTFLDWLMVLDSFLCLGNCFSLIGQALTSTISTTNILAQEFNDHQLIFRI